MATFYRKSEIPEHLQQYFCPAEIGLESTPEEYVEVLVGVFREVRRVLRDDGTLWLNLGDSYFRTGETNVPQTKWLVHGYPDHAKSGSSDGVVGRGVRPGSRAQGKPKDLVGIPWMVAFALRSDGWYLRSDIIWAKKSPMPESVRDRPTSAHEHIFLFSKSSKYFYDADAVREQDISGHPSGNGFKRPARLSYDGRGQDEQWQPGGGRNLRNVWHLGPEPYPAAHFATFPREIPRRCIAAGCPEGETVLDPFAGSNTTLLVAAELGRRAIGIELNAKYTDHRREAIAAASAQQRISF